MLKLTKSNKYKIMNDIFKDYLTKKQEIFSSLVLWLNKLDLIESLLNYQMSKNNQELETYLQEHKLNLNENENELSTEIQLSIKDKKYAQDHFKQDASTVLDAINLLSSYKQVIFNYLLSFDVQTKYDAQKQASNLFVLSRINWNLLDLYKEFEHDFKQIAKVLSKTLNKEIDSVDTFMLELARRTDLYQWLNIVSLPDGFSGMIFSLWANSELKLEQVKNTNYITDLGNLNAFLHLSLNENSIDTNSIWIKEPSSIFNINTIWTICYYFNTLGNQLEKLLAFANRR